MAEFIAESRKYLGSIEPGSLILDKKTHNINKGTIKLLIVDDSAVIRKVMCDTLELLCILTSNMLEVRDCKAGVKTALSKFLTLIFIDWYTLGIDMVKAISTVCSQALIAKDEKKNVILTMQAGTGSYLAKPFNAD